MTNPDNVGGLLPCPFCGGEAELVGGEQDEFCHWHVQCAVCGAISGESLSTSTPDRDFASESWNRRELCRAAPADNAGGLIWYVCTSCMLMVQLPSDTPTLGRCQCSPKGWSLRRAKLPKGYELCRAAPAGSGDVDGLARWWQADIPPSKPP